MNVGDIATIYDDPLTEKAAIGKAKLLKRISDCGYFKGDKIEMWRVRFLEDDGASHYSRLIRQHTGEV